MKRNKIDWRYLHGRVAKTQWGCESAVYGLDWRLLGTMGIVSQKDLFGAPGHAWLSHLYGVR